MLMMLMTRQLHAGVAVSYLRRRDSRGKLFCCCWFTYNNNGRASPRCLPMDALRAYCATVTYPCICHNAISFTHYSSFDFDIRRMRVLRRPFLLITGLGGSFSR